MEPVSRKQRTLLFLYSTPNIVGSALGLVGLLLYFAGIIGDYWLLIVAGLYAIGLMVTPRSPAVDLRLKNELTVEELRGALDRLAQSVRGRVPQDVYGKVLSIKESIFSILPRIVDVDSGNHDIYVIRQTALEYLPDALENYLNLPPAYANLHPVRDGKSSRQLLAEQLDLLDSSMKEIVEDFNRDDTQKLVVHGRFLEQKFRKGDLLAA